MSTRKEGTGTIPNGFPCPSFTFFLLTCLSFSTCRPQSQQYHDSVVDLPPDMLCRYPALTNISISGSNPFLILEEPFLYYENKSNLILCLRDTEGSITVPEGTEHIQEYTFSSCRQLTRIVLPDTVACIMPNAFADCTALESIELPSSLQVIETQAF